jgi:hypothetical protein
MTAFIFSSFNFYLLYAKFTSLKYNPPISLFGGIIIEKFELFSIYKILLNSMILFSKKNIIN